MGLVLADTGGFAFSVRQVYARFFVFFSTFLDYTSPFYGATGDSVLDFWWCLPWVSKPGWIHLPAYFVVFVQWIPQIHLWWNTCWPLGSLDSSWVYFDQCPCTHICKHWWGLSSGLCVLLPHRMWQDRHSVPARRVLSSFNTTKSLTNYWKLSSNTSTIVKLYRCPHSSFFSKWRNFPPIRWIRRNGCSRTIQAWIGSIYSLKQA